MDKLDSDLEAFVEATSLYLNGDLSGALKELVRAEQVAASNGHYGLLVSILAQKGGWLREAGRPGDGEKALQEAEKNLKRVAPKERELGILLLCIERGRQAMSSGHLDSGAKLLEKAVKLARRSELKYFLPDALANLGSTYMRKGKFEESQKALAEAEAIDKQTKNTRSHAHDLNLLGQLYGMMGNRSVERTYLEQSINEAIDARLPKETADAIFNLAINLDDSDQPKKAAKLLRSALAIYTQIGSSWGIAATKSCLGILACKNGDLLRSRRLLKEAYQLHVRDSQSIHATYDMINLASVDTSLDPKRGYLEAIKAARTAEKIGLMDTMWAAEFVVGRARAACLLSGSPRSLIRGVKTEVLPAYERAMDQIELMRGSIPRPEQRGFALWNKENLYHEALQLAASLGLNQSAFMYSERSRARAFVDSLGSARIERTAGKNQLSRRRQKLTEAVSALMQEENPDAERIRSMVSKLEVIREEMSAKLPSVAAVTEANLPTFAQIKGSIPTKSALVEFYFDGKDNLCIFVVTAKGVSALRCGDLDGLDLSRAISRFRAEIENDVDGVPTGEVLFDRLLGPIWNSISQMESLFIIPHRELHYLPFAALRCRHASASQRFYLCEQFTLSYLPSAACLPLFLALRGRSTTTRMRILGDPLGDLPHAEDEARVIAAQCGVEPLLHEKANRRSFLNAQGDFQAIHIASHGTYNEYDALLSGVELADGLVTAESIMESRISTSLLTLNACFTGITKRRPGDELVGLPRAAMAAGIPTVITTLWAVRDRSAAEFFKKFYVRVNSGTPKGLALARSQREMIGSGLFSSPVHWASYVLLGDPR